MTQVYLGVITNVLDNKKFIVEATVKGLFESLVAYPIDLSDKPEIKDSILIYVIDSELLGQSLLYQKLRIRESTRMALGNNEITLTEDGIQLRTENTNIEFKSNGTINIDSDNEININSNSSITIDAPSVEVKSGGLNTKFNVPFVCPYTNQTHVNVLTGV